MSLLVRFATVIGRSLRSRPSSFTMGLAAGYAAVCDEVDVSILTCHTLQNSIRVLEPQGHYHAIVLGSRNLGSRTL